MSSEIKDNKRDRIAAIKALISNGRVVIPEPRLPDCVLEYLSEPPTILDDQMDAMSLAFRNVQRKRVMR